MEAIQRSSMRAPLLIALGVMAVLLVMPFPGSLSVVITEAAAGTFAQTPHIGAVSEAALVVLAIFAMASLAVSWHRKIADRRVLCAVSGAVIVAYAISEGIKLVFAEPRPCAALVVAAECPAVGDWSLPSNHATLAFAAVAVIAVATRWISWTAVALSVAVIVAAGRVMQGVHYFHDVVIGGLLGLTIVSLVALGASHALNRKRSPRATGGFQ